MKLCSAAAMTRQTYRHCISVLLNDPSMEISLKMGVLNLLEHFNITFFLYEEFRGRKNRHLQMDRRPTDACFFSLTERLCGKAFTENSSVPQSCITVRWLSIRRRDWSLKPDSHSIHTSTDLVAHLKLAPPPPPPTRMHTVACTHTHTNI